MGENMSKSFHDDIPAVYVRMSGLNEEDGIKEPSSGKSSVRCTVYDALRFCRDFPKIYKTDDGRCSLIEAPNRYPLEIFNSNVLGLVAVKKRGDKEFTQYAVFSDNVKNIMTIVSKCPRISYTEIEVIGYYDYHGLKLIY